MSSYKETLKTHRVSEGGVSYYIKTASKIENLEDNEVLFPQTSAIMNAFYLPYLTLDSFESGQVTSVDVKFPTVDGVEYQGNVGRLNYLNQSQRTLSINETVNVHENSETSQRDIGGVWRWQNEAKCHLYPYSFFMYTDGFINPLIIYPQFVPYDSTYQLTIRQYLNMNGLYQLSLNGYRGDYIGMYHGVQCQGIPIPTAQSSYVDWKIANKNQRMTNYLTQGVSAIANIATGNYMGAVSNGLNIVNSIQQERDMQNQPNAIVNQNADFSFQMQFNMVGDETQSSAYSGLGLRQIHYRYNDSDMYRIALTFHYYGTKQNQFYQHPNLRVRQNFDYIKGSDIVLSGVACPKDVLEKLRAILQQGTTIWHMDTDGNYIGNYAPDNVER